MEGGGWGRGSVGLVGGRKISASRVQIRNVGANPMCSSSSEICDGWL